MSLEQIAFTLNQPTYSPLFTLEVLEGKLNERVAEQKKVLEKLTGMRRLMQITGKTSTDDMLEFIMLLEKAESSFPINKKMSCKSVLMHWAKMA